MFLIAISILGVVSAHPQLGNELDPALITEIFGKPEPVSTTQPRLEDITVRPTEVASTFVNQEGNSCQCVPYYLCDGNHTIITDPKATGWGKLDVRFGEDDSCQESVELCCQNPKPPEEAPVHTQDPAKLSGCGVRNTNGLDFHITGGNGNEAQFGEFPWVVALLDGLNGSYAGVGVLIHPQVVMTGAHIAYKYGPGLLKIRAGEWDTQTTKERLPSQERTAVDFKIRHDFNGQNLHNDIALLNLDEPLELADHINVICMPSRYEDFSKSKRCVANGWGKNTFGQKGRYAVILKKVELNMVEHMRCNSLLRQTRLGKNYRLHESFVCAGGTEGVDTCEGDGGAPLACPFEENRYKLTGLVAWGIGCGVKNLPAVYTNVALFRDWVDNAMRAWGYSIEGYNV